MKNNVLAVIPARYGSTRFPGKPLAILGTKPVIQHVWERVIQTKSVNRIIIATENKRILRTVRQFGGEAMLTSPRCRNGTERCAEVVRKVSQADIIVNVQGDEPFISPVIIDRLVTAIKKDRKTHITTPVFPVKFSDEITNPSIVKVTIDRNRYALYFSRALIPSLARNDKNNQLLFYKHIGIYCYRRESLLHLVKLKPTVYEKTEKLEQLRALEYGYKIKVVFTRSDSLSIDTPSDLVKAEKIINLLDTKK